jgi:hypothetical protein
MEREGSGRKPLIIGAVVATGIVVVIGAVLGLGAMRRSQQPFPARISNAAPFPLYYPTPLPNGYNVTKDQIQYDLNNRAVMVPITTVTGHRIALTEQAKPNAVSFNDLLGKGKIIPGARGEAAISSVEGRTVASMISADHKTLILLNSEEATSEELTTLVTALKATD